jgi:hypothetical protein
LTSCEFVLIARRRLERMSKENPLWGAPRIHGELLKLGFVIAESTVSKYMARRPGPPSQTWRTFLRNHADAIAAIDLCVVPTLTFEWLFAFLVLGHGRRQLLWFRGDPAPDGRVVGAADRGGIPVGHGTDLSDARQRWSLWVGIQASSASDGDSGPPDITEVALAESIC